MSSTLRLLKLRYQITTHVYGTDHRAPDQSIGDLSGLSNGQTSWKLLTRQLNAKSGENDLPGRNMLER
jgi:hypothetical protein